MSPNKGKVWWSVFEGAANMDNPYWKMGMTPPPTPADLKISFAGKVHTKQEAEALVKSKLTKSIYHWRFKKFNPRTDK